jgi:hypothetical protein
MQRTGTNLQQHSLAVDASVTWLLTDWVPAAYQQTSCVLIGHWQRADLDSAASSSEEHYSQCCGQLLWKSGDKGDKLHRTPLSMLVGDETDMIFHSAYVLFKGTH